MTIKEASRITGVSTDNLRYYERIGLIPKIKKNESGIRVYDDADIGMIELVARFKSAGMKLSAIREYVDLAMSGEDTAEARRKILVEARDDLVERLEEIRKSDRPNELQDRALRPKMRARDRRNSTDVETTWKCSKDIAADLI